MKTIINAVRSYKIHLCWKGINGLEKLERAGIISLWTCFKVTSRLFNIVLNAYVKMVRDGYASLTDDIVEAMEKLDALLDK